MMRVIIPSSLLLSTLLSSRSFYINTESSCSDICIFRSDLYILKEHFDHNVNSLANWYPYSNSLEFLDPSTNSCCLTNSCLKSKNKADFSTNVVVLVFVNTFYLILLNLYRKMRARISWFDNLRSILKGRSYVGIMDF